MKNSLTEEEISFLNNHGIDALSYLKNKEKGDLLVEVNALIVDYLDYNYNSTNTSVYVQRIYDKILDNY